MGKYKILISGYYGFGNIGDESILKAVTESLKSKLSDIEITVLSKDPADTEKRYGVKAKNRKSVTAILSALSSCDLLISGGGSLLQDVTSKRSIHYYLDIIRAAELLGKDVFIYSQGIGPINDPANKKAAAKALKKCEGIVVRDQKSKEFLTDIGLAEDSIAVTADPVLRLPKAGLEVGAKILESEGLRRKDGRKLSGFAVKEKRMDSGFMAELEKAMARLLERGDTDIVLIPFHYEEDSAACNALEERLIARGFADAVLSLKHKYLTEEMLSIIGNMDILTGVRLHSLIHAAIMDVPMIGISYDPKINSFLNSVGLRAVCSIYDFNSAYFLEEYEHTMRERESLKTKVAERKAELVRALDKNEEMIAEIRRKSGK